MFKFSTFVYVLLLIFICLIYFQVALFLFLSSDISNLLSVSFISVDKVIIFVSIFSLDFQSEYANIFKTKYLSKIMQVDITSHHNGYGLEPLVKK